VINSFIAVFVESELKLSVLGFKNMPAILQQKQNFGCFLLFRNGNSRCYALYWHTFELY
jgi:hypothetical protein